MYKRQVCVCVGWNKNQFLSSTVYRRTEIKVDQGIGGRKCFVKSTKMTATRMMMIASNKDEYSHLLL